MYAILYMVCYLVKHDPSTIAGFKRGVVKYEISQDDKWLKTVEKATRQNMYITLTGGVVTSFLDNYIVYLVMLNAPTLLMSVYICITMPKR